ncbi:MAG: polysaccharide biosynthesis tyrosine autokinase [Pseudomonadota bacterium]
MNLLKPDQKSPDYSVQMVPIPNDGIDMEEDSIDLRALLLTIWRGRWIIVVTTLVAIVLAFLSVSQMEPRYRASAKVMFDIQQSNVVNLQEVLVDQQFDVSKLEDQIQVLRSTTLIERVIADLSLNERPLFNPLLRPEVETWLSRPEWLTELLIDLGIQEPEPLPPTLEELERLERRQVINNVLAGLGLTPVGRSRVIEVSYTSPDPNLSAAIANSIGEQYIVDQLEAKLEATRAATSWLSSRVEELRERVQAAEESVESARAELSAESGQSLEITKQQLESLNAALAELRSDAARMQSLYDRLTDAVENGRDLGAISEFRESDLLQRYRAAETELKGQEAALLATVPDTHPALARVRQQLTEVQKNIDDEARRIVAAAEIDLNAVKAQEESLIEEVRRLENKALEQSREEVQLRQLDREAEASRVLYENFLARLQETSEQEDLQQADARVLSPAEPPLTPEAQRRRRTLLVSVLAGIGAGIGIIFLLDRLNNTFRSPSQLEEVSGENVLATLPAVGQRMQRKAIIDHLRKKPSSSLAESVRNLRTSILFSNIDKPPKVVMFTSTVPREGKTTTSMLIALTSRQMGKSAIIVDCDLRLPALAKLVDSKDDEEQVGLLSVMENSAPMDRAIHVDPETGLHMLMTRRSERTGKINPADILSSRRFQELVRVLSNHYDLVVLDTPPALVVTDARIVSHLADAIVYAVHWDKTPRGAVLEGLRELKSVNAPIAGLVLTMVNEARASKYAYDGYSYYKGRYKDYYVT